MFGLGRGSAGMAARCARQHRRPAPVLGETALLPRQWWQAPHRATSPGHGHFRVRDWERAIHPRRDQAPVYLAAAGPRALHLSGTLCDGAVFNEQTSDDFLRHAIQRVRAAAMAAGRDPAGLAFGCTRGRWWSTRETPSAKLSIAARTCSPWSRPCLDGGLVGLDEGFHIPALLDQGRGRTTATPDTLATGGGFPALRRSGDLTGARGPAPGDLIRRPGVIGSLPVVRGAIARSRR